MHFSVPSHSLPIWELRTKCSFLQSRARRLVETHQQYRDRNKIIKKNKCRLQAIFVSHLCNIVTATVKPSAELVINSDIDIQILWSRDEWNYVSIMPGWFQDWNFYSIQTILQSAAYFKINSSDHRERNYFFSVDTLIGSIKNC